MQRGKNEIPGQSIRSKSFEKKVEEKISHLMHGREAEAGEKVPEGRSVEAFQQTGEVRDEACLHGFSVKKMNACEKCCQNKGIFTKIAVLPK